jgi:protease-4
MDSLLALLRAFWRALDFARRLFVNVIFLLLLVIIAGALLSSDKPIVPSGVALVVAPGGRLVEERSGDPVDRAIGKSFQDDEPEAVLRDLVDAIDTARDDDRIEALVLDLGGLWSGSLPKLQEVAGAVDRFRQSGKPVIAYGGGYSQEQYLIAAHADEVLMDPMGLVLLEGYGSWQLYYKEAIDKLGVNWNVFRVGEYKSYVEPFTRTDMSPEARLANREWLDALWQAYQADVVAARELEPDAIGRYVANYAGEAVAKNGDLAAIAVEARLVDKLMTREEARQRVAEIVGEDDDSHSFEQVGVAEYLNGIRAERSLKPGPSDAIAVIVAAGDINDGDRPPGSVGGDSTSRLVRDARFDDSVKAIVLRIDSPGGSQFASEQIRRELALARADGKPVIVSMSGVAASGGYWIALAADEVWASPSTVTGSIGIFGMFPTFEATLGKIGVRSDGVGTTPYADALRIDRPMRDEVKAVFQSSIEHGYAEFIGAVAEARDLPVEKVDELARGRVWIGSKAQELGLVDNLGGFNDAVAAAATAAGLEAGDYKLEWTKRELSFGERLLIDMFGRDATRAVARTLAPEVFLPQAVLPRIAALSGIERELKALASFNDPAGRYAYCFCEPR